MKQNYKGGYFYSIKLNNRCENCNNEYIRIDDYITVDKRSKKELEEMYDDLGDSSEYDMCDKCNSYMFPDEIIDIKEFKIKDYNDDFNFYISDKNKIIPNNSMQLMGITLEGTNEANLKEAITLDLNESNFKSLYLRGKELWDNGFVSKYTILFFNKNKCFMYARPDLYNFEKYFNLSNYLTFDNGFENLVNIDHLINKTKEQLSEKFDVEIHYTKTPTERSDTLEI